MIKFTLFLFLAIGFLHPGWAAGNVNAHSQCVQALGSGGSSALPDYPGRSLEFIDEWTMMSFNLENLYELQGKLLPDPTTGFSTRQLIAEKHPVAVQHREDLAKVILAQGRDRTNPGPDIFIGQEVESMRALERFNQEHLEGRYHCLLIEGNDPRGIDVAMMIKRDLPLRYEYRSSRNEVWKVPNHLRPPDNSGLRTKPMFSRDLPVLIIRTDFSEAPLVIVVGTHLKSKRSGYADSESKVYRAAQASRTARIIHNLQSEFGHHIPIFLGGDFNGSVNHEKEFETLYRRGLLVDAFDLGPHMSKNERVTHTFHPSRGRTLRSQMDAWLLNRAAREYYQLAWVHRYHWAIGDLGSGVRPFPKSKAGRAYNPSDHFPVLMQIDFRRLYFDFLMRNHIESGEGASIGTAIKD